MTDTTEQRIYPAEGEPGSDTNPISRDIEFAVKGTDGVTRKHVNRSGGNGTYTVQVQHASDTTAGIAKSINDYESNKTDTTNFITPAALKTALDSVSSGGNTITRPVVTGDTAVINQPTTFHVTASAALQNAYITQFKVSLTGCATQTVTATDNACDVTFTVPSTTADEAELTLTAIAYDNYEGQSPVRTKTVTAKAVAIVAPTFTVSSYEGRVGQNPTITVSNTFAVSGNEDTDFTDTLDHIEYVVKLNDTVVWSTNSSAYTATVGVDLLPNLTYDFEVRYVGNILTSDTTTVQGTTPAAFIIIGTPTVTLNSTSAGLPQNLVATGSTFSATTYEGALATDETHASTNWKLYEDGVQVWQSLSDTTNLTSIAVSYPLVESKAYRLTMQYVGSSGYASSEVEATGTTPAEFEIITTPTLTLDDTASGTRERPTITGSTYHVSAADGTDITASRPHAYTNWRCYKVVNGVSTLVWQSLNDNENLTSITLNADLEESSTYRFECEYASVSLISLTGSVTGTTPAVFEYIITPTVTANTNSRGLRKTTILTGSVYSVSDGTNDITADRPHISTTWRAYSVSGDSRTLIAESVDDTTNKTSWTVPVSLTESMNYVFECVYKSASLTSTAGSVSGTTPATFEVVTTPTVTIDGWNRELPTLTGSAYEVLEGSTNVTASFPHSYTNWRCYRIENGESTLVWSSLNDTTNLTSITLNTALDESTNYRFECEYGCTSLVSDTGTLTGTTAASFYTDGELYLMAQGISLSDLPGYTAGTAQKTASNRVIYRHSNNKGSVLVYDRFGITECVFFADAQYRSRGNKNMEPYGTDISTLLNTNPSFTFLYNDSTPAYVSGSTSNQDVSGYASIGPITDAQLQVRFNGLNVETTAADQCTKWLAAGSPTAIQYARGLTSVMSGGLNVPLMYQAIVAYVENDYIDALDPTVSSYTDNRLGKGSNEKRWFNGGSVWSCSEFSNYYALRMNCGGNLNIDLKNYTNSVLPVAELGWFYNGTFYSDMASLRAVKVQELMNTVNPTETQKLEAYGFSSASNLPGYQNDGSLQVTEHGRLLYRHSNGKGSVVVFDMFGTTMKLFVADAAYRGAKQFASGYSDSRLTNFTSDNGTDWYIRGQGSEDSLKKTALGYVFTDSQLQSKWSNLSPDLTARQNCDVWMTHSEVTSDSNFAVPYARSLTSFTGIDKCDVPNEYECMVLYLESDNLDTIDPTGSSNGTKLLGYNNSSSNGCGRMAIENSYAIWASTEFTDSNVRFVTNDGYCLSSGGKTATFGVVPICEL